MIDPSCSHYDTDAAGNCRRAGCTYNSDVDYFSGDAIEERAQSIEYDEPYYFPPRVAVTDATREQTLAWARTQVDGRSWTVGPLYQPPYVPDEIAEFVKSIRSRTIDELYRIVERVPGRFLNGPWTPVRTRGGAPRTYTTARAARSAATQLRNSYQRFGIEMEVAVQRAPVGAWEVIDG